MIATNFALLIAATVAFVAAASTAKVWAVSDGGWAWLLLTLGLYTIGNLVMLRLVREAGMGVALSLSAVIQLAAINLIAVGVFGERMTLQAGIGIAMAVVAVALITMPGGSQ